MLFNYIEESEATSIFASLQSKNCKRDRDIPSVSDNGQAPKLARSFHSKDVNSAVNLDSLNENGSNCSNNKCSSGAEKSATKKKTPDPPLDATGLIFSNPELKPAPFFYYSDHSLEQDDDPLTPVTAAGRIPTFPAKMHAILTNPALQDVVAWAPHGRSWRILKPRDFEVNVLPRYFEHSKFSSFVRQANGWGFRRLAQGRDRNAYYHEYFLRSMPWLCKKMRRPKVAEKKAIDPDMEPDFDAISAMLPVPNYPITSEILIVQQTIEKGPRARMPVHWATDPLESLAPNNLRFHEDCNAAVPVTKAGGDNNHFPSTKSNRFNSDTCGNLLKSAAMPNMVSANSFTSVGFGCSHGNTNTGNFSKHNSDFNLDDMIPPASNNQMFNNSLIRSSSGMHSGLNNPGDSPSESQFAKGFMAATAYHSQQIRKMLGSPLVENASTSNTDKDNKFSNFYHETCIQDALELIQNRLRGSENTCNNDNSNRCPPHVENSSYGLASNKDCFYENPSAQYPVVRNNVISYDNPTPSNCQLPSRYCDSISCNYNNCDGNYNNFQANDSSFSSNDNMNNSGFINSSNNNTSSYACSSVSNSAMDDWAVNDMQCLVSYPVSNTNHHQQHSQGNHCGGYDYNNFFDS